MVMVINTSNRPTNILLQWRRVPSFHRSEAPYFKFRDVTRGSGGWKGWSSIGIGVSGVPPHGCFVLIVSEMEELRDGIKVVGGISDGEYVDIMYDSV